MSRYDRDDPNPTLARGSERRRVRRRYVRLVVGRASIGPLGRRRVPSEKPSEFRRDGAFAVVRNPMYLGSLLASGGPLVAAPRPFNCCWVSRCARSRCRCARFRTSGVCTASSAPVYEQYCREVKRLIPFIW
jgi:protein-S-isoprenylcysteine O-methyltransferase Ste14